MTDLLDVVAQLRRGRLPPMQHVPERLLDAAASLSSLRGRLSELTSVERALTALRHREPDRVPVAPMLCSAARQITRTGFRDFACDSSKAADVFMAGWELVGGDIIVLMQDLSVEAADFGQPMIYPEASTARPDYANPLVRDVGDYRRLRAIELSRAERMQGFVRLCRTMVERVGLRAIVTGFLFGPLGVLGMMRGAEALFKDCVRYPRQVKGACETVTQVLIDFAEAQCTTGVPAIAIDTLYASSDGLPKLLWEEIEGPFVREISRAIKRHGLLVGIHNCGHQPYFDAQIRWMEPEVISFAHLPEDCPSDRELKRRYGGEVTLLGYVPTPLLVQGSAEQVMLECRRQLEELGPGGGFALAPGCEYPPNIPLTNAFALVKAAQRWS